jgi:ligand-binding sensor domain-containing protein
LQNGAVERFAGGSDGGPLTHVQAALEDHSGQVWARAAGGLFKLVEGQLTRVPAADAGRSNWVVTALHEDRRGRLWIGSDQGLLEPHSAEFIVYTTRDGLSDNDIRGIRDAPDGSLWVGTKRGGLNQFKDGRFKAYTTRHGLLSNWIWPLVIEGDGTIWAGTPVGLNRIRDGEVRAVTEREGLSDNRTYSLLDDGRGDYWGHCNRGIFRVRQADLHAVADGRQRRLQCVSYGESDGMASTEGNGDYQPNAARQPDGRLWFPMTRGVVVLDPREVARNDVPPPIVIEHVMAK